MSDLLRFGSFTVVVFVLMLLISDTAPPDNAVMVLDATSGTYASIPCAKRGHTKRPAFASDDDQLSENMVLRSYAAIMADRASQHRIVDDVCLVTEGLWQSNLERLFVKSRWTGDGHWRW